LVREYAARALQRIGELERLGDPFGNGRTAIRAGYGIFYAIGFTNMAMDMQGQPFLVDVSGWAAEDALAAMQEAYGAEPVQMGSGGSIPFIADLVERYPNAQILITGVEDPDTRAHGANEGLHLAEFERVCLAETLLLANLSSLGQ